MLGSCVPDNDDNDNNNKNNADDDDDDGNNQKRNGTYEFLSGVPITERTQFLRLNDPKDYERFQVGLRAFQLKYHNVVK